MDETELGSVPFVVRMPRVKHQEAWGNTFPSSPASCNIGKRKTSQPFSTERAEIATVYEGRSTDVWSRGHR
jgi:hypothetical protein